MMFRKLLRTMVKYKAQFISMIIMIALGMGAFIGFNIEWHSIDVDTEAFFNKTGFADYRIVRESGFSEKDLQKVKSIKEVEAATRFISVNMSGKDDGDVLAVNVTEDISISGFLLISGEEYDASDERGIWLSDRYAVQNGIAVGDELELAFKDIKMLGIVRGLVKSGEYLICLPDETQMMPDYSAFGFAYVSPAMLKDITGSEYYTQINVKSALGKQEFKRAADNAFGEAMFVASKEDTVSYSESQGEVREGKTMGLILPVVLLAIAVLTMVTTMHRLTSSEKTQIGMLKALGFKDRRILRHYTSLALMIGLTGTAAGVALGRLLAWSIVSPHGAMGTYLDMDDWSLSTPKFVWAVVLIINVMLVFIGHLSVRSMLRGTAADSLRPYTPKKVKPMLIEKFSFWNGRSFGTKWNMRDTVRHKARSLMSLFGIVGCVVILTSTMGMKDTADKFIETFYHDALTYENRINLDREHITEADVEKLTEKFKGDRCAQSGIEIDGEVAELEVYGVKSGLIKFIGQETEIVKIGDGGAYICERIAKKYSLGAGDRFTFSAFGTNDSYTVRVEGVLRSMSKSVIMTETYADKIGYPYSTNIIYTAEQKIPADNRIINAKSRQSIIDSFDLLMNVINKMVYIMVVLAVILGVVVLYNLGIMSYTERYREMATLKVIGFKDGKIARLLISQNVWVTAIGICLGIPLGILILKYLNSELAASYEMKIYLGWRTYAVSVLLTFAVSVLVGVLVALKNRKIDMVEALKVPE